VLILVEGTGKISWSRITVWGMLQCCKWLSFLRNPWPNPIGVLEHCRQGNALFLLHFLILPLLWGEKGCQCTVLSLLRQLL
jgi:hypothetical protein